MGIPISRYYDLLKAFEEYEKRQPPTKIEIEDKTMKHNVTITKEENRVIEEYWVMRGIKTVTDDYLHSKKKVIAERERAKAPTHQEIAQFLSETQADFVSVEHNYRFADLPFC